MIGLSGCDGDVRWCLVGGRDWGMGGRGEMHEGAAVVVGGE